MSVPHGVGTEGARMPDTMIARFVRAFSGRGALDNVSEVLAARASIDAERDALAARVVTRRPIPVETPAAA
jgi:hypothetical protein